MSAVRKLNYDTFEAMPSYVKTKQSKTKVKRKVQPWYQSISIMIIFLTFAITVGAMLSLIVNRYVMIDDLQLKIFNTKQEIIAMEKEIDALVIQKESYMTIEEIENYAVSNLDMIKPTERHKVIVMTEDYMTLNKNIAFKPLPDYKASAEEVSPIMGVTAQIQKFISLDNKKR